MNIVDVADEIYRELGSPSDITIPEVAFWVRTNVGLLNNLINTAFSIDSTTLEFSPDMGEDEKVIYKLLYYVRYYNKKINDNLGASGTQTLLEVTSDGSSVRRVNKTELAKTYLQLRKESADELMKLALGYKSNASPPRQVVGIDSLMSIDPPIRYNRTVVE